MAKLVWTTKGFVDYDSLVINDVITETDTSRDIATEYVLDGELVRRDLAVSILRPVPIEFKEGSLG